MLRLPVYHIRRMARWVMGDRAYPFSLSLLEMRGHLVGPAVLLQSRRRVRRQGRSAPTVTAITGEQGAEET